MKDEPKIEDYDKPSQITEDVLSKVVRELKERDAIAGIDRIIISLPEHFWFKHPILEMPENTKEPQHEYPDIGISDVVDCLREQKRQREINNDVHDFGPLTDKLRPDSYIKKPLKIKEDFKNKFPLIFIDAQHDFTGDGKLTCEITDTE